MITAAHAREILRYDPETGSLRWRARAARCAIIGAEAGNVCQNGYVRIQIGGVGYLAHRLAWLMVYGEWPSHQIDHIDCNRRNNALGNLRSATASQNKSNSKISRKNKSGFKGVFCVRGRWIASIKHEGKSKHLGCFDTPEIAHAAYVAAAQSLFGDFARAA
jgi:hypothetical protein